LKFPSAPSQTTRGERKLGKTPTPLIFALNGMHSIPSNEDAISDTISSETSPRNFNVICISSGETSFRLKPSNEERTSISSPRTEDGRSTAINNLDIIRIKHVCLLSITVKLI